jgi:hypothetical protein
LENSGMTKKELKNKFGVEGDLYIWK